VSPARRVIGRHLLPLVLSGLFVLPVAAIVLGSLRDPAAPPPTGLELVPAGASTDAYRRLTELLPIGVYLRNSVVVTALAVPLSVLVAAAAGWGIRLLPRRARVAVVVGSVLVLLIPASALWATRFRVYAGLGLIGSVLPMVAPALLGTSPFLVLLYAWAYGGVGDSQIAAARLEGASTWRIWRAVALPQVRTATTAVAVLSFTAHWGNYLDALLYLRGQEHFTLPLGLDTLKLLRPTEFPLLLAGASVFALPSLAVFLLATRLFEDPAAALRRPGRS
jgi:multiple sugar transport system permease protein